MNLDLISNLLSFGVAFVNTTVTDASGLSEQVPSYEVFAQCYLNLSSESLFLRPAVRLSYEPSPDIERSKSVAITEKNFKSAVELGLLYNWHLVPTMSLQGALIRRSLDLSLDSKISRDSKHDISRTEYLWQGGLTVGLGVPVLQGDLVLEPFYRFIRQNSDDRRNHQWGLDVSYAISVATE